MDHFLTDSVAVVALGNILKNDNNLPLMSLSETELEIIFTGMDRTDYTSMGYPRYKDLEMIKKQVLNLKIRNGNKTLTEMSVSSTEEKFPPNTYYRYKFEAPHCSIDMRS
jgi:hypothetical protein